MSLHENLSPDAEQFKLRPEDIDRRRRPRLPVYQMCREKGRARRTAWQ